ncbi:hypothetical protein Pst134EB_010174 [Puccinia striiformis f. sp. tritici]|nr:hypothetical protein Pst134EB_010174 [Puccinia striiformis f. sp. tritici]
MYHHQRLATRCLVPASHPLNRDCGQFEAQPNVSPLPNLERFGSLNSFFIISRSPCNHEIPTTNLCYRRVGYGITSSRSTHF